MIKVSQNHQKSSLYPDLTPLLDIIFIVMVFLMLTASVRLESLQVDLPTTESSAVSEVDTQSITVNILAQEPIGLWMVNTISTGKTSNWLYSNNPVQAKAQSLLEQRKRQTFNISCNYLLLCKRTVYQRPNCSPTNQQTNNDSS